MFIWRADAILGEIDRQMPALGKALQEIGAAGNLRSGLKR